MKKMSILLLIAVIGLWASNTDVNSQNRSLTTSSPFTGANGQAPVLNGGQSRGVLLFDQAATGYYSLYADQIDPGYPFEFEFADNFTVPFMAFVDSIVMWGGYWNGTPVPPTDFLFKIFEDSVGYTRPKVNPIFTQNLAYLETNLGTYYQYECPINPPILLQPGQTYWVVCEANLTFPPQFGIDGSWPGNSPEWGDGQEAYFRAPLFGYNDWVNATTVWGSPVEGAFQIWGEVADDTVRWDFETGLQGWTHTNGNVFPGAWAVKIANYNSGWAPPAPDDSSMWIDSDEDGGLVQDTALSPVLVPNVATTHWFKLGVSWDVYSSPEMLEIGIKYYDNVDWTVVPLAQYTASVNPRWDSFDVSAYATYPRVQLYVYHTADYGWWASFDNVSINGEIYVAAHDVLTSDIVAPPARTPPNTAVYPVATFRNNGNSNEDFTCNFRIDSLGTPVYTSSVPLTGIIPATDTTITFTTWTPGAPDGFVYNLLAFTVLTGDVNPGNDTAYGTTTVSSVSEWTRVADMPSAELAHGTGYDADNDKIYTFCGTPDGGYTYTNYVYQYDPVADAWATMANAPYALDWVDGSYVNGKFYVFGGFAGSSAFNYNMIYDVAGNSWSAGTAMPLARMCGGQVVYNDSLVYMLGGSTSTAPTNNVQIYNTFTNAWTTGTALPANFQMGGVAIVDNVIYIVGGYNGSSAYSNLYVGTINTTTNETIVWTTGTALPIPNCINGATQIQRNGNWYVYLVGGFENLSVATAAAWEYDVAADAWIALPNYPFPIVRNDFLVARDGLNEIYVCGGDDNGDWTGTVQTWKLFWTVPPGAEEKPGSTPKTAFGFAPNMNPVKSRVSLSYTTPQGNVSLKVYDGMGRLVKVLAQGTQPAGTKTVTWNFKDESGRSLMSGVYFVRLEANGQTMSQKLVLVK